MTLDNQIKKVFHWNVEAFKHIMIMMKDSKTPGGMLLLEVAKAGYVQNAEMFKVIEGIIFQPGNEETEAWDSSNAQPQELEQVEKVVKDPVRERDLKELEHIYNLEEQKAAEQAVAKANKTWYEEFLQKELKVKETNGTNENDGTAKS